MCSPLYARTAFRLRDFYTCRLRRSRGLAYIQDAHTCEDSAYERPVHPTSVWSLRVAFLCSLAEMFFFFFFFFIQKMMFLSFDNLLEAFTRTPGFLNPISIPKKVAQFSAEYRTRTPVTTLEALTRRKSRR